MFAQLNELSGFAARVIGGGLALAYQANPQISTNGVGKHLDLSNPIERARRINKFVVDGNAYRKCALAITATDGR